MTPAAPELTPHERRWLRRLLLGGLATWVVALFLHIVLPPSVEAHVIIDTYQVVAAIPGGLAFMVFLDVGTYLVAGLTMVGAWVACQGWRRTARTLRFIGGMAGVLAAWGGAGLLKVLFARARPDLMWADVNVSAFSFPSGHATLAAALVVAVFVTLSWRLVAPYAVLAVLTAVSRLVLGVHWPTDILGGLGWGAGVAAGVALLTIDRLPQVGRTAVKTFREDSSPGDHDR